MPIDDAYRFPAEGPRFVVTAVRDGFTFYGPVAHRFKDWSSLTFSECQQPKPGVKPAIRMTEHEVGARWRG